MAQFPRLFQHFASGRDTGYQWVRIGPISLSASGARRKDSFVRSFRATSSFCNINPKYVNMADITATAKVADRVSTERTAAAEPVWDIIELLFFAYRDFVGDQTRCCSSSVLDAPTTACSISSIAIPA